MRALLAHGSGRLSVDEVPDPEVPDDGVVLRVGACTICGSDLHDITLAIEEPRILGHEIAGTVVAAGSDVDVEQGTRVAVLPTAPCDDCPYCERGRTNLCGKSFASTVGYGLRGGFAEYVAVPRARVGATLFPLPDGVDFAAGAVAEPLAVAVRAVTRSGLGPGKSALIFGGGAIGLLTALVARDRGADPLLVVEPQPYRRELAESLGLSVATGGEDPALRALFAGTPYGRPDVVVDAAGIQATVDAAAKAVRRGGVILVLAGYAEAPRVDLTYLLRKEVDLVSSFAYTAEDYRQALDLLGRGVVSAEKIVTHRLPLERAQEAVELAGSREGVLKVAVTGPGS